MADQLAAAAAQNSSSITSASQTTSHTTILGAVTSLQGSAANQTTITLTATHTVQGSAPGLIFGLPQDLVGVLLIVTATIVWLFLRFNVKSIPVRVLWIFKNNFSVMFDAKEDLGGIFIDIVKGRKKVQKLRKEGLPIEVREIPAKAEAYSIVNTNKGSVLSEEVQAQLKLEGYTVIDKSPKPETNWRGKLKTTDKAYLVQRKNSGVYDEELIGYDVSLGGLKHTRLYVSIEGTGTTKDLVGEDADKAPDGRAGVLQEEVGAAQEIFKMIREAAQSSWKAIILPMIAGGGLFSVVTILILIVSGRLH